MTFANDFSTILHFEDIFFLRFLYCLASIPHPAQNPHCTKAGISVKHYLAQWSRAELRGCRSAMEKSTRLQLYSPHLQDVQTQNACLCCTWRSGTGILELSPCQDKRTLQKVAGQSYARQLGTARHHLGVPAQSVHREKTLQLFTGSLCFWGFLFC